jgi:hypothetical protein
VLLAIHELDETYLMSELAVVLKDVVFLELACGSDSLAML